MSDMMSIHIHTSHSQPLHVSLQLDVTASGTHNQAFVLRYLWELCADACERPAQLMHCQDVTMMRSQSQHGCSSSCVRV